MSTLDVLEVEKFYQTPRGQVCQRMVQQKISSLLSCVPPPQNFLGVGYVSPYLEAVAFESQKWEGETFLFMPHTIGAIANSGSLSPISLVDCHLWPLADCSIDFIFMTHALEHSTYPSAFLREAWRVLKNDGFLLMLVPNRRGLWARTEKTPFGHGHPYTRTQLITLFQNGCFLPLPLLFFFLWHPCGKK
jgi:SAM-dependent methyltransferase